MLALPLNLDEISSPCFTSVYSKSAGLIYSHKRRATKINPCPVEFDEGFALLEFQKNLNSFGSHHLVAESRNSFVISRINLFGCHRIGITIQLRIPWITSHA
jgi:hypothetical protein